MPILDLARLIVETYPMYVQRLDLLVVVGVVLFMVFTQYQRGARLEAHLYGFVKNRPLPQLGTAMVAGFLGGVLATVVFIFIGIPLNEVGIWYLWMAAIALMFLHPRFLCFAYGGGILSLSHLLFGFPRIDVAAVMALVALLHFVEAVLIFWTGAQSAMPVFVNDGRGNVVGGFTMQRFWPLPFVALIGMLVTPEIVDAATGVDMPDWWPIISPAGLGGAGTEFAFFLLPVVAALGYSDLAVTTTPERKARRTAGSLLVYSVCLLALAVMAREHIAFAFAAALFSPLAHEWVIFRSRRLERDGPYCYTGRDTMVLDVHPDSPAARAGLRSGDIILEVNGIAVKTREDLADAMRPWAFSARIEVENAFTRERRTVTCNEKIPPLGVLLVPRANDRPHIALHGSGRHGISRWREKFSLKR